MNLLLLLLISVASAAEITPIEAPAATVIRTGKESGNYHLIRAGHQLDFDTLGPINLTVEVRQRLASTQQRAEGEITAVGDGVHAIMTITIRGGAEKQGFIDDAYGGVPSKIDSAKIKVPDGGKMLSLVAPASGGDFLVRVMDEGGLDPAVIAPVAPIATVTEAEEPDEEPTVVADRPRPKKNDRLGSGGPAAGMAFGLGVPARGTKAVGYIAAEGRYPIYKNFLSAGAAIGWYRIGVNSHVAVSDPYAGTNEVNAVWTTNVVPIVGRIVGHLPLDLGPVVPMAGAGLGFFIAKRKDGAFKSTRLGFGPELLLGSEFELGEPGRVGAHFSWNGARVRYGNRHPDGEEVRETIATTRLNIRYLYLF